MFGIKEETKNTLIGIGYAAGDLANKSKKVLEKGDQEEIMKRILKNQIFLLRMINEHLSNI